MPLDTVRGRILTAERMQAHNTFDAPEQVLPTDFAGATVDGNQVTLTLPAKAVVVLELKPPAAPPS